jgi:hypothetical protein
MAISEKAAAKPAAARAEKANDDKLAGKVVDALDPTTGGGVQDVVQVPSVDKSGTPDQTPGHVVLDPEAADAADQARKESAVPTSAERPDSAV